MLLNLAVQKESFRSFLVDTQASFRSAIEAIEVQRQEIARRSLHTIKGNSGFFGLDTLVSTIHAVEDKAGISLEDVVVVEDHLRKFVERIEQVTGPLLDEGAAEVRVSAATMEQLEQALRAGNAAGIAEAARSLATDADRCSAQQLLGPMDRASEVLAHRFEKDLRLEAINVTQPYSQKRWGVVFQNLVHLLRNAVDHGIEAPWSRGDKPAQAVVRIEFLPDEIIFSDDGRGIDVEAVVAGAIHNGSITGEQAAKLSREQRLQLIFVDGLSTAQTVTETSGRGVGMSAVRETIRQAGGSISIETEGGHGTTIRLRARAPDAQMDDGARAHL